MIVGLSIEGDGATGEVQVTGQIDDMRIVYWLLGEAKRICERRMMKREEGLTESGLIVVAGKPT